MNDGNEPPLTGVYGVLRVDAAINYIMQTAMSLSSCDIYVRGISEDQSSTGWTNWRKV